MSDLSFLRAVARDAGSSLGSLSYRIGDKASLVGRLIEEERAELTQQT